MKKIVFVILAAIMIISCEQKATVNFKFADQEQVISCSENDNPLLNEALYSFENDLYTKYDSVTKSKITVYGRFIYRGMDGSAPYTEIKTPHTTSIVEALASENILIKGKEPSAVNYEHPAVQCIVDAIENDELKVTIKALIDTKTMNPKLFNTRFRNFGRNAERQRNLALFIALEGYYQQILNLETPESTTN